MVKQAGSVTPVENSWVLTVRPSREEIPPTPVPEDNWAGEDWMNTPAVPEVYALPLILKSVLEATSNTQTPVLVVAVEAVPEG
jgi:hypothetical protein